MDQLTQYFPPSIIACNHIILCHSVTQNSLSNYTSGLLHFTHFCNDFNICELARMPASEALLCLFISSHGASHVGHGTLTNWITGLELWHSINGAPWLGKKHLACPIKGAASAAPSPSSRLPCLPILISHLQMLHGALDLANTFDALVDAIVCIGFWSQCRLVELCLDAPFDPQHHASRSSVRKSNMASNRVTYSGFFAPYMKIKPCGDWIYWTCSGCICSANKAFINHLEVNSDLPMNAPLFAFERALHRGNLCGGLG